MLTFFRRIRKGLLSQGAVPKYLLYAIGEIALVVIGILIALQINNWNEWRKDREDERIYLVSIKEELIANRIPLETAISVNKVARNSMKIVLTHLSDDLPYHDSLNFHFSLTTYLWDFWTTSNAFESLKSRDLNIISNQPLRDTLSAFYGGWNEYLRSRVQLYQEHIFNNSNNLLNSRFEDFWNSDVEIHSAENLSSSEMVPLDFESLKGDQKYLYFIKSLPNIHYFNILAPLQIQYQLLERCLELIDFQLKQ